MKVCSVPVEKLPKNVCLQTDFFAIPLQDAVRQEDVVWIERNDAEKDFSYKHLITYAVFQSFDGKIACYPRHGSEKRLRGLYSCGIGGHIDECDKAPSLKETVENGLRRELFEELKNYDGSKVKLSYLGLISEKESEVGLVHLGAVYLAKCDKGYLPVAAEETKGLEWKSFDELRLVKKELWSDLALKFLEKN
mgnify:CR=1 FL=1